jgi:hypothetical protein
MPQPERADFEDRNILLGHPALPRNRNVANGPFYRSAPRHRCRRAGSGSGARYDRGRRVPLRPLGGSAAGSPVLRLAPRVGTRRPPNRRERKLAVARWLERTRAPGAALPLFAVARRRAGTAPAHRGRPRRARPQNRMGGWHQPPRLRTSGPPRTPCRPRPAASQFDLIATILDPATIQAILRSMGMATEAIDRAPPGAHRGLIPLGLILYTILAPALAPSAAPDRGQTFAPPPISTNGRAPSDAQSSRLTPDHLCGTQT